MNSKRNKSSYKKMALVFSLCALILWGLLGTGASLAWFTDTTPEINNIFHFADFDLELYHRLTDGKWEKIDSQTKIFDEKALYEPGYIQVIYLKVENKGSVDFNFNTAVNVNGCTLATNVFGQPFALQDYLKFGTISSKDENTMKNGIENRESAKEIANLRLNNYTSEKCVLKAGETTYITLVVRMPEDIGNITNYRGEIIPKVELGLIAKADQIINK